MAENREDGCVEGDIMGHRHSPTERYERTFPGAGRRELAALDRHVTEVPFRAGDVLMSEGAIGHQAFIIVDGEAEVRVGDRVVARARPGDVCGELALLGTKRRGATVVAVADGSALVSSRREFASLLAAAPNLAARIRRDAGVRLADKSTRLPSSR
ncbi:MAG: cyclic nucleotide-binding domain-containing protein [Desertimonas sp.]